MNRYFSSLIVLASLCLWGQAWGQGAPNGGGLGVPSPSTSLGSIVSNFNGLNFALAQGSLGAPSGTMTGYATYDNITLQCTGVSFSTSPVVSVDNISAGAVTLAQVITPGITTGSVPSGSVACSQASTTGVGTGYKVQATLGIIAAGIGPNFPISANGNVILTNPITPSADNNPYTNISYGFYALSSIAPIHSTQYNTAVGFETESSLTTADHTVAIGSWALASITSSTGSQNAAFGVDSLRYLTSGTGNTALGIGSLTWGATQTGNTGVGWEAGYYITGITNEAFGQAAMSSVVGNPLTGSGNVAIGSSSLYLLQGGAANNTALGHAAGSAITTGNYNTLIGANVGQTLTTGAQNILIGGLTSTKTNSGTTNYAIGIGNGVVAGTLDTCVGAGACAATNADYQENTAFGYGALAAATAGPNIGIGYQAGKLIAAATGNVVIGPSVGSTTLSSGTNNILIGTSSATDTPASSSSNEVNIGGLLFFNKNSLAAPAVTACGTSPSIDSHANNKSGTVTVGTGAVASCTITLAGTGYTTWNHCRVTSQSSLAAFAYSYTKTVITVTATSLTSDSIDYDCDGY